MNTFDESGYALLVFKGLRLLDQIDLVLENNDIIEFHDLDSSQMF